MAFQEANECRTASGHPALVHRRNGLIQGAVRLLLNQRQNLFGVIFQRGAAATAQLGSNRPIVAPKLRPADRRGNADAKAFSQFRLGRQPVPRLDLAELDLVGKIACDQRRQSGRPLDSAKPHLRLFRHLQPPEVKTND